MGKENRELGYYVEQFRTALNEGRNVATKLCKWYSEAVDLFGQSVCEAKFTEEFPVCAKIGWKYFLAAGRGETCPEIIVIPYTSVRDRVMTLPIDVQKSFFKDGVDVYDYVKETVVRRKYLMDKQSWAVLWSDRIGGFRPLPEQLAYIHNDKNAKQTRKLWSVNSKGELCVSRRCRIKPDEVVQIFIEVKRKCPDLEIKE